MRNKRGLSGIINMLLMVLLVIAAIGVIWVIISTFVVKGSGGLTLEKYTLDLKIKSVKINFTTGTAEVRVVRNPGEGELSGIKFIVADDDSNYIFEERVDNLEEYADRTFVLNLIEGETLNLPKIEKVSIAPIFIVDGSGKEASGDITDSVGGLDIVINRTSQEGGTGSGNMVCTEDIECGEDSWVVGSEVCDGSESVNQYKRDYSCQLGFCTVRTDSVLKQSCVGETFCSDGKCVDEVKPCTVETVELDCGGHMYLGERQCSSDGNSVIQDYKTFLCINLVCSSSIASEIVQECIGEEGCVDGECFIPVECRVNSDCWEEMNMPNGKVCTLGSCTNETVLESGVVFSAWPYGMADYIDSADLPLLSNETNMSAGMNIIFTTGNQEGCLRIKEFVTPDFEGGISYVKFVESPTNVSDGDEYEVWETSYICSTL